MPQSKKNKIVVRATTRQREAMELRIRGYTFQVIADKLGISNQAAQHLVSSGLRNLRQENAELAVELRQIEMMRLDEIQYRLVNMIERAENLMDAADKHNQDPNSDEQVGYGGEQLLLQTIDRLLKVVERRAKIAGLERPEGAGSENDPWVAVLQNIMTRAANALGTGNGRSRPDAIPATVVSESGQSKDRQTDTPSDR